MAPRGPLQGLMQPASDAVQDLSWGDGSRSHEGTGRSGKTTAPANMEPGFGADFENS